MIALIVCHFALAACARPLVRWFGRHAFVVLALPPAAATVWAATQWSTTAAGRSADQAWEWIPAYDVWVGLRLDALAELMVLLAAGVGTLVLLYCASYFTDDSLNWPRSPGTCWPSPVRCSRSFSPTTSSPSTCSGN